jgi:hypothetical protein
MPKYHQGFYHPKYPEKYRGDLKHVVYRSGWERKTMVYLDLSSAILKWSSEEIIIPYRSPIDNKRHRYFPDFWALVKTPKGTKEIVIEIKPFKQTQPPSGTKKRTRATINEALRYVKNDAKWRAARIWCENRGMEFQIITERDMNLT